MKKNKILVTGSSGLVGGEVVNYFCDKDFLVYGIDNNMRGIFFGAKGSTESNLIKLSNKFSNFSNYSIDIRDRNAIDNLICDIRPDVIVHTAAQPSHDKAAEIPFLDFEVNAVGTLNLLEASRNYCKESPFIHLSTNKVYGESPNQLDLIEL